MFLVKRKKVIRLFLPNDCGEPLSTKDKIVIVALVLLGVAGWIKVLFFR